MFFHFMYQAYMHFRKQHSMIPGLIIISAVSTFNIQASHALSKYNIITGGHCCDKQKVRGLAHTQPCG